jgi:hypothetical protein
VRFLKYIGGWVAWHVKAGFWYAGLLFRLWFAIGLDRDFDHGSSDREVADTFKCPYPRNYREHLRSA